MHLPKLQIVNRVLPRALGTLVFLLAWLVPWRPAFRVRAAQSGLTFFVHHRDTIGRHIAKYGTHEPLATRWIADYLAAAPPGIVVDIGANIGWHALHAARHRQIEAVVAFEPDPFNAWLIERNLSENGIDKVIVDARAVGTAPGVARLFRYKSSNFGRHSLAIDHGYGSRAVPVTDLDGALAGLGYADRPIALLKIDAEGYEPAIVAGAQQVLTRTDAIILEYSSELNLAGGPAAHAMLERLHSWGFTPFALRGDGGIVPVTGDELRRFTGALDLIWVKTGRLAALADGLHERDRGALSLQTIAEQNLRVVKPI